jgi:hypothetical protein
MNRAPIAALATVSAILLAACVDLGDGDQEGAPPERAVAVSALTVPSVLGGSLTANRFFDPNVSNRPQDRNGLPLLHSNPEAGAAIFLDFDGGTFEGTTTTFAPFDYENSWPSATSLTIGTGLKRLRLQNGNSPSGYAIGDRIRIMAYTNAAGEGLQAGNYMEGTLEQIIPFGWGTEGDDIEVNVIHTGGSGQFPSWVVHKTSDFVFSPAERAYIFQQWHETAAYLSMFNVDVTTEQPAIGPSTKPFVWAAVTYSPGGGYGGDFLANIHPTGAGPMAGDTIPNTNISHEAGHAFRLAHTATFSFLGFETNEYSPGADTPLYTSFTGDNTAQVDHMTKWVTKFAGVYGTYPIALNPTQDDVETIAAALTEAGVSPYRGDYIGNTRSTAKDLIFIGNNSWAVQGVIDTLADRDYYKFQPATSGFYSILVGRDAPAAIDMYTQIEDSSGKILASQDGDPSGFAPLGPEEVRNGNVYDQHLTMWFDSGATYYILAQGHGNYADLGQYVVRADFMGNTSPWQDIDVGFVGVPGYTSYDLSNGQLSVAGSGNTVGAAGSPDSFNFCFQKLKGNGSISVKLTSLDGSNDYSQAGVMMRASLDPNANFVSFALTKKMGWHWQTRTAEGYEPTPSVFSERYIKMENPSSNQWKFYVSTDGSTWTQVATTTAGVSGLGISYVGVFADDEGAHQLDPLIGWVIPSFAAQRLTVATMGSISVTPIGTGALNPPAYTNVNALTPPTLTVGTVTSDSIQLNWTSPPQSGKSDYRLEQSTDGINYRLVASLSPSQVSFTVRNLHDNERYWYRMRTAFLDGSVTEPSGATGSRFGVTRAGTVDASSISLYSLGTNLIALNWTDVDGETSYNILRSTNATSGFQLVGSAAANKPFFQDSAGKVRNTLYYYKIETVDSVGSVGTSSAVSGWTRWTANKPTGLIAASVSQTQIVLDWNDFVADSTTASVYRVYRNPGDADDLGGVHTLGMMSTSGVTDTGLAPGTTYKYWVLARSQAYSTAATIQVTTPE